MTDMVTNGKTTLTPDVLVIIARMAALDVEGVKSMAMVKGGVNSLLRRGQEGVRMAFEGSIVLIDLYLVLKSGSNIREVGRMVQQRVARAITEMTGLEVGHVNVHIENIDYSSEE